MIKMGNLIWSKPIIILITSIIVIYCLCCSYSLYFDLYASYSQNSSFKKILFFITSTFPLWMMGAWQRQLWCTPMINLINRHYIIYREWTKKYHTTFPITLSQSMIVWSSKHLFSSFFLFFFNKNVYIQNISMNFQCHILFNVSRSKSSKIVNLCKNHKKRTNIVSILDFFFLERSHIFFIVIF